MGQPPCIRYDQLDSSIVGIRRVLSHSVRGVVANEMGCWAKFTNEGGHNPRLYHGNIEKKLLSNHE